jgi:glycerol-3-phosphate dehydrogenase (NAD(P)+)
MDPKAVAVVGGGKWGVALAAAAARKSEKVTLVTRRQVEVTPRGVTVTRDLAGTAARSRLIVLAVPSTAALEFARMMRASVTADHIVLHGVRGLVGDDMRTLSDVIAAETPVRHLGALGGPALASELMMDTPSVLVVGASDDAVGRKFIDAFMSPTLRIYTTSDLRGVEWASALVGCLAIVVGYAREVGVSPGSLAAAITRGVQEASRLTAAAGGAEQTLLGLAGFADLLAVMSQRDRPEVLVGAALARGLSVDRAAAEVRQRVEGLELIPRLAAWAAAKGVRVPIFSAMANGAFAGRPAEEIIHELMTLPVEDPG